MRIKAKTLSEHRAHTFRTRSNLRISSKEQAIDYVNERGFIYFWPIKEIVLPSLWTAVAGDRPVADAHDDPGHVTWGWKDSLLGKRVWYYAKVLRKRSTLISLEAVPYFYALSENYGSPEEDYLIQYQQGRMTQEAKAIYEALLDQGVMDTIALRRAARLSSPDNEARFNRALAELQADFKVLPVGVTEAGAWHYSFAYDLSARHFPDIPEKARFIQEGEARKELAFRYLLSVGAAQSSDLIKLFGWTAKQVMRSVESLALTGRIQVGLELEGQPGDWIGLSELV